jgi:hypothetical protein
MVGKNIRRRQGLPVRADPEGIQVLSKQILRPPADVENADNIIIAQRGNIQAPLRAIDN